MGESPILNKTLTAFDLKSANDELRQITGIASTPSIDFGDDELDPLGAKFSLPMKFFWNHKQDQPIGHVIQADVTAQGILIKAQITKWDEPGRLKDRLDECWQSIKAGLVSSLSVGWKPIDATRKKSGGMKCKSWHWVETSAVTLPMNLDAAILSVKSAAATHTPSGSDRAARALPGASGTSRASAMTYSEQIQEQQTELQTKSARLEELEQMDDRGELGDDESKERDTIVSDIQARTKKIERLAAMEAAMMASSKGLSHGNGGQKPTTGVRVSVRERSEDRQLPPGTLFTRYAMAVAAGKGSMADTLMYAKRWDRETPEVSAYIKAIAGTSRGRFARVGRRTRESIDPRQRIYRARAPDDDSRAAQRRAQCAVQRRDSGADRRLDGELGR